MKRRTLPLLPILACLHAWALFAGLYPFFACLFSFPDTEFVRLTRCTIVVFLPLILGWLLLACVHNFFLYILLGLLVTAADTALAYFLGGPMQPVGEFAAVLSAVISLIIFGVHIRTRVTYGQTKREFMEAHGQTHTFSLRVQDMPDFLTCPQPFHWVWLSLMYVPGMLLHYTVYLYFMFTLVFCDIFVCLLHCYVRARDQYMMQNQSVANFPARHMRSIHRTAAIPGFVLLLFFLLPAVLFGREFQPDLTTDRPLVTFEEVTETAYQPIRSSEMADTEFIGMMEDSGREAPKWLLAILTFIGYLFLAACAVAAIISIIFRLRSMGRDFAAENADEIVSLDTEGQDESRTLFRTVQKERFLSINQRVRRLYKRTIKKATKGTPGKCSTPAELEREASLHNAALHAAYEKARYSKEGASKEEWNRL